MAHGHPDYGQQAAINTVAPVTDLGELAVRLGSHNMVYRSGTELFYDDFERNLGKWKTKFSGTGAAAEISTAQVLHGASSLKLTPGTTASKYSGLTTYVSYIAAQNVGLEISIYDLAAGSFFRSLLDVASSTINYVGGIIANAGLTNLQYYAQGGVYTDFAIVPTDMFDSPVWTTLKFVIDTTTGKYVRCQLHDQVIDMSALSCASTPYTAAPYFGVDLLYDAGSGAGAAAYFDNVIATINEP